MNKRMKSAGFTLMELMIVVAIVGILAGIALPSYQNSIIKASRRAAQSDLLAFSQSMEKEYAIKFTYANAVAGAGGIFPAVSPVDGGTKMYDLSIPVLTATTYTIRATPVGRQAGNGILEMNHLGQKFWDRNDNASTSDAGENTWD